MNKNEIANMNANAGLSRPIWYVMTDNDWKSRTAQEFGIVSQQAALGLHSCVYPAGKVMNPNKER